MEPADELVSYHGFTQAGRIDRQELRLLFERAPALPTFPSQRGVCAPNHERNTRAVAVFEQRTASDRARRHYVRDGHQGGAANAESLVLTTTKKWAGSRSVAGL